MRSPLLILLLLASVSTLFAETGDIDEAKWKQDGLTKSSSVFAQVTRAPHPDNKAISALHCETEADWWGKLVVVRHDDDVVRGFLTLPDDYLQGAGHYVRSFSWHRLREVGWVLQVFTSTHRGNGSLWLFEIEGDRLRTLMTARAVADNDECWFDHGQLQVEHLDGDVTKPISLRLHGIEHRVDEFARKTERKIEEHWVWQDKQRMFVTQPSKQAR